MSNNSVFFSRFFCIVVLLTSLITFSLESSVIADPSDQTKSKPVSEKSVANQAVSPVGSISNQPIKESRETRAPRSAEEKIKPKTAEELAKITTRVVNADQSTRTEDLRGLTLLALALCILSLVLGVVGIALTIAAHGKLQKLEILAGRALSNASVSPVAQESLLQSRSFQEKLTMSVRTVLRQELAERESVLSHGSRDLNKPSPRDREKSQKSEVMAESLSRTPSRDNRELNLVLSALATELEDAGLKHHNEEYVKLELADIMAGLSQPVSPSDCQELLSQLNYAFASSADPILKSGHFLRLSRLRSESGVANVRIEVKSSAIQPLILEAIRRSGEFQ